MYGYIVIYICYGILLSTIIAQKRFPFEDELLKAWDLDAAAAEQKAKKLTASAPAKAAAPNG